MTIQQFHTEFKFGLDKLDNLNYPNFEPEEIDLLLNQAQERFIKQRYGITNTKRESFEQTEKRTEDLKAIIQNIRLTNSDSISPFASYENLSNNSIFCKLPDDHWFTIAESAIINCTNCNRSIKIPIHETVFPNDPQPQPPHYTTVSGIEVEVRPTTHLEVVKNAKDDFKGPDLTKVLRVMYKSYAEILLPTDCSLVYYTIRYIRKPIQMSLEDDITCELSEHTHSEILSMAIAIALEGIEAKRQQSYNGINNTNE